MKATDKFKDTIKRYLDERASQDELFAISYAKEHKNLDECINYIFKSVQASGCNGFADEEIYGMAIHYYDEDDIKDVKPVRCQVVVNHQIELTEEEKLQARKDAIDKYQQDCINKMRADEKAKADKEKAKAKATKNVEAYSPSLF
jgi:hypothetical protein